MSQSAKPASHAMLHTPALHDGVPFVLLHALPHLPQSASLRKTSVSHPFAALPSQSANPAAQPPPPPAPPPPAAVPDAVPAVPPVPSSAKPPNVGKPHAAGPTKGAEARTSVAKSRGIPRLRQK